MISISGFKFTHITTRITSSMVWDRIRDLRSNRSEYITGYIVICFFIYIFSLYINASENCFRLFIQLTLGAKMME